MTDQKEHAEQNSVFINQSEGRTDRRRHHARRVGDMLQRVPKGERIDRPLARVQPRAALGAGSRDPFPPYTEPPINIEAQPIKRR